MATAAAQVDRPEVIRLEDISKRFVIRKDKSLKERIVNFGRSNKHKDDFWALRDVAFTVESGNSIGLVGANGSGKSTLLKVIGGIIEPTSGMVERRGRVAALLELGAGFHPDLTGRENVFLNAAILGLSRKQTESYFDSIVDFSEIGAFIDTQVKFFSSGMYVRLAFAIAVHVDPDILLVDEVLAVGDEPFQKKCLAKIAQFKREGRTIVFVSHAAAQIEDICDRVIVLSHGSMVFDGAAKAGIAALRKTFKTP
jgi:ABC-type polysaccharide/polyol phosphate transport system ATPase subunit